MSTKNMVANYAEGQKMWFNRCCSENCQRRWRAKNRSKEALCYVPGFSHTPGFEARKYPRAVAVDKMALMSESSRLEKVELRRSRTGTTRTSRGRVGERVVEKGARGS